MRFEDIAWDRWTPQMRATLLFIIRNGQVLLIQKKRGLGAGKINGPGGRLEPGETPRQAAIREVEEELRITPLEPVEDCGLLQFQFTDGLTIEGYVFRSPGCRGEPMETDEAMPLWVPFDRIPYDRMWADDRIWMPELLACRRFYGRFLFDGDQILGHALRIEASTMGAGA